MTIDRTKYMSPGELEILRAEAQRNSPEIWLLVDLATQTGLRVSELAKITVKDIDLRIGAIRTTRSKKRDKQLTEWLPISPSLLSHLRQHLQTMASIDPNKSIWSGQRGPLTRQGLQKLFNKAVKLSGLPKKITIHSARHTMAVQMLRTTKNLRMVQKQLGHASINTTASQYADVPWEDRQEALTQMFG